MSTYNIQANIQSLYTHDIHTCMHVYIGYIAHAYTHVYWYSHTHAYIVHPCIHMHAHART